MSAKSPLGNAAYLLVPLALSAVFLLDVIGPLEPFVSVLYIPILILAAKMFNKGGVVYLGAVCVILTAVSYVLGNVEGFDEVTIRQFGIVVASVIITTVLLAGARRSSLPKLL